MGMLSLNRLMIREERRRRQRRRRRIEARSGLITSVPQEKELLCQEIDHSQGGEMLRYSGPDFPEHIWCHIHSLMPLRDSARSASVSFTFLHSWRCYPKLTFTEEALGLKQMEGQKIGVDFTNRVDHILKNHSGTGVKILKLVVPGYCNVSTCQLTSWLQNAITPGIEEVNLSLPSKYMKKYNFPCSILHNGCGNSIRYLCLTYCAFRPTSGFVCLRSLTKLDLYKVSITGDELGCVISNTFALEKLMLRICNEIICLKIPFWLERLSFLDLTWCRMLQVIENAAPNLTTFKLLGDPVQMSFGISSQVKNLNVGFSFKPNILSYAITKLPSVMPHLENIMLSSSSEMIDTPMVADKFLHLKHLKIFLSINYYSWSPAYDFLSLASFLDASPLLETFFLSIKHQGAMEHDSGDDAHMRRIPGYKHCRLRKVRINGFFSAKGMVELTCHILEVATSLESLTVDTVYNEEEGDNISRCSVKKTGECWPISRDWILEAHKTLGVIKRYILERVPSTVKINVGEPCRRCHCIDVIASNI